MVQSWQQQNPSSFLIREDSLTHYHKMSSTTTSNLTKKLNSWLHPKLCCLDAFAVTHVIFPDCSNNVYGKLVVVIADEATTTCSQRNTTAKVSKYPCVFHCTLSFEEYEHPLKYRLKLYKCFLEKMS